MTVVRERLRELTSPERIAKLGIDAVRTFPVLRFPLALVLEAVSPTRSPNYENPSNITQVCDDIFTLAVVKTQEEDPACYVNTYLNPYGRLSEYVALSGSNGRNFYLLRNGGDSELSANLYPYYFTTETMVYGMETGELKGLFERKFVIDNFGGINALEYTRVGEQVVRGLEPAGAVDHEATLRRMDLCYFVRDTRSSNA